MVLAFLSSYPRLAHQLQFFHFGLGSLVLRSHTFIPETGHVACSGGFQGFGVPNPSLNSDPACIAFALSQRLASSASFIASAQAGPVSFLR